MKLVKTFGRSAKTAAALIEKIEQRGAVWLEIMYRAARFCNAALPVSFKADTDIKIRKKVICAQAIEQVASFDAVHAAKDHVAKAKTLVRNSDQFVKGDHFPPQYTIDIGNGQFDLLRVLLRQLPEQFGKQ